MSAARVLAITALTVVLALVLPDVVLRNTPSLWPWLSTAETGSDLAVLGTARSADPEDVDVVVLGSSLAGSNVSTWILERDSGLGVVNLGLNGANAVEVAMWRDEVLRLEPEVVVWMTGPMSLEDRDLVVPSAFDWGIALKAWGPGALLRSDVWTQSVREASLLVRLRGVPALAWDGTLSDEWVPIADQPEMRPRRFRRVAALKAEEVKAADIRADSPGARAMVHAIGTFQAAGVRVVVVPAPLHPTVLDGQYFLPAHLDALAVIAEETGVEVVWPDAQAEWELSDFRDPVHLGHAGQRKLTRTLIEVVQ